MLTLPISIASAAALHQSPSVPAGQATFPHSTSMTYTSHGLALTVTVLWLADCLARSLRQPRSGPWTHRPSRSITPQGAQYPLPHHNLTVGESAGVRVAGHLGPRAEGLQFQTETFGLNLVYNKVISAKFFFYFKCLILKGTGA